jgi:TPR repeat protein
MYFKGWGVAPDRAEAVRWFRKAAANGDDDAKEALKGLGEK